MRAKGYVARILHHIREQISEHSVLQRVEVSVSLPNVLSALGVALNVSIQNVLH